MPINVTFFADTVDVRAEGAIPDDILDPDIQEDQEAAVGIIKARVGEYDQTHARIATLKEIEKKIAASFGMDNMGPEIQDQADKKYMKAKEMLEELAKSLTGAAQDVELLDSVSSYQSWPAALNENPDTEVTPYKSTAYNRDWY